MPIEAAAFERILSLAAQARRAAAAQMTEDEIARAGEDVRAARGDPHHARDPPAAPRSGAARADPQGLRGRHLRAQRRQPAALALRGGDRARAARLRGRALPARLPGLHRARAGGGQAARLRARRAGATCRPRCTWPSTCTRRRCTCSWPAARAAASRRCRRSSRPSRTCCSPAAPSASAPRSPPCTSPTATRSTASSGFPRNRPSCALLPIGWPRGRYGRPPRRSVDECLFWERYEARDQRM